MVKRVGNLFDDFVSIENLTLASKCAQRGKKHRPDVIAFNEHFDENIKKLQRMLINEEYTTSEYYIFKIVENGKVREVADLPFYPDRIVHWALMNVLNRVMVKSLIHTTYAALPRRGMHKAHKDLVKALKDDDAKYFLKIDIEKYFPSIEKDNMYLSIKRRVKDKKILSLCNQIIYEYPLSGIPIGNYTSQYFANYYLSSIDHFMKEKYHCKYYFRYMDDVVILGWSKPWLRRALKKISELTSALGLKIKGNWCIRPVSQGIDFVGFVSFKTHSLIRKRTKLKIKKVCRVAQKHLKEDGFLTEHDIGAINSYHGYIKWCNCKHLFDVIGLNDLYKYAHENIKKSQPSL